MPTPWLIQGVVRQPYAETPGALYTLYVLEVVGAFLYGAIALLKALFRSTSPSHRNQIRYVLAATTTGLVALGIYFFVTYRWQLPPIHYLVEIGVVLTLAMAIVRYRLMDINLAMTRTAVFIGVYTLALGLPLLAALSLEQQLERALGTRWWIGLWIICAALATAAHYANLYFQRRAENKLLAEQRRYQTVLRQAAQGMTLIKEMGKLLNLVVHILTRTVRITHAAVYLLDKEAKVYVLRARRGVRGVGMGYTIPAASPLIEELKRQKGAIVQEELKLQLQGASSIGRLQVAEQMMEEIEAAVAVPSFVQEQLIGFLVLGEKRSGKMYSQDDLQVFEVLASQAALAVENAQFYDELQRTQADLFQTAKMATLGQMAGGMSHQINNRFYVLTILAGTMKAALKALDPATADAAKYQELWQKAIEAYTKIEDNAIRGGDIVKTLLRFSRPGRGDQKPVSVQEIVETALDVVQYKINLGELDFAKEFPSDLPLIQGNLNQLADSLFNLFSNAYDAIQSKKERLKPEGYRGAISVKAQAKHGKLELTIVDNGIGMTPQEQMQMFIPFFTTKATAEKGTGLGLFVIKRIIEHHGGQITVRSTFGEGTTFVITLPAAAQAQVPVV